MNDSRIFLRWFRDRSAVGDVARCYVLDRFAASRGGRNWKEVCLDYDLLSCEFSWRPSCLDFIPLITRDCGG